MGVDLKMLALSETKISEPICNVMEPRSEFCEIENRDVRVNGKVSSVYVVSSQRENVIEAGNNSWNIRPYARKDDVKAISLIRKWSVKQVSTGDHQESIPKCTRNHSVPAILFSLGGYTLNQYHDFADVIIPLYVTSRKYNGEVQFLITENRIKWIQKFQEILKGLSKYELIDIDKELEQVHCFPSVTVGLKTSRKEMTFDPLRYSYSMKDFRGFLRTTYSLKRANAIKIRDGQHQLKKPRLLIISRNRTRSFTNTGEITQMARDLGYKVTVAEADMNVSNFANVVNSCDVMMGVHGAGLLNMLFLPENAIFIQIIPVGKFQWISTTYYGGPAKDMNLKYLEYKISNEESTLIQQYPLDHAVFTDPISIGKQGWMVFKSIYLNKQNVKLNVTRFKPTLLKALELLQQ
ncbi:beta-1,2-xylosyltransferase XYXT1 [Rosa chinensis]|uniref:beta-1,2-xylosyltransferase XYXT1 n=1 Tax=Rosa chinensis TaxID=74649 RepID=UPI000D08A8C7|nr:beta-1,2-xylosyltransferase XYXT1 [Rosa chinensis]